MKEQIKKLKDQIEKHRELVDDEEQPLATAYQEAKDVDFPERCNMRYRRVLKGHFGKIYSMHWSQDHKNPSANLVSASQDGKLIIWNAFTTNKLHAIPLRSSWVMTCAFSPSGQMVACGGLDNLCSVYQVPKAGEGTGKKIAASELAQHEGYLSCCRFIDDTEIITSSGDSSCILWDVESKRPKSVFNDHEGDVMSVAITNQANCPNNNTFVSGSCDSRAKLWDYRAKNACVKTFEGHESDINSVDFFPDGNAFGTGSDDSSCRLFDIRSYGQVQKFADDKILCGITSLTFSKSGVWMFAGYDDYNCWAWNVPGGDHFQDNHMQHENRVSCVGMKPDGKALCTGSWDTQLKIWA